MNQCLTMKGMACLEALFSLAVLLAPNELIKLYDRQPMNGPGTYKSMLCGTFLLGLAVMN